MSRLATLLLLLPIAACVTFAGLEAGLDDLLDQPIETAISRIGFPQQDRAFGDKTIYTWSRSFSMDMPHSTNSGASMEFSPSHFSCRIDLIANSDGIIESYQYDGSLGGCEGYIEQLRP